MKKKLLNVLVALVAIAMPNLGYAQSQEAAGTYNGTLNVTIATMPAGSSVEDVHLIVENDNHIRLEIRNFKFAVGGGDPIVLGDIIIPNVEVKKEENNIIILPTDAIVSLPDPINDVNVHLNESSIVNNKLSLTLSVQTIYPAPILVGVTFEGDKTKGSGVYDVAMEKVNAYYNAATGSLIVKGAENLKYDIYNVTGMQILSGILNAEEINVSNLTRGIYLIKIGNNTVKFIKQ